MVQAEGLIRARALRAAPHAFGVPVGLLASRSPDLVDVSHLLYWPELRLRENGATDGCCPHFLLLDREANMLLFLGRVNWSATTESHRARSAPNGVCC